MRKTKLKKSESNKQEENNSEPPQREEDSFDEDGSDEPQDKSKSDKKRGRKASKKPSKKSKKEGKAAKRETTDDDEDEEDEEEYEVERILEVHSKKNGKREFLIQWKGYPKSEATWEPEDNLNCEELISAFLKKVSKAKEVTQRETRINRKHTDRFVINSPDSGRKLSARTSGPRRTYYDED